MISIIRACIRGQKRFVDTALPLINQQPWACFTVARVRRRSRLWRALGGSARLHTQARPAWPLPTHGACCNQSADHWLRAGCNCLIPCCGQSVAGALSLRVQQLDVQCETKTKVTAPCTCWHQQAAALHTSAGSDTPVSAHRTMCSSPWWCQCSTKCARSRSMTR